MTSSTPNAPSPSTRFEPLDDETKRQIDLAIDIQVRIIASAYEKANAYTNLMIIAGYAGFFALWQMTNTYLGKKQTFFSALLMLLSIMIFVLFEIYKAHFSSGLLRRYQQTVQDKENRSSPEILVEKMNQFEAVERNAALRFVRLWQFTFWATTITGVAAGLILAAAFVHRLALNFTSANHN